MMRNIILAICLLAIPSLAMAGVVSEALFTNVTGTETLTNNVKSPKCIEAASVQVVMGTYSGAVAVQASIDRGTTYVTYTTVPQAGGTAIYNFPIRLVPTNIKVVPTDTYTTDTSRSGVSAHISYRECD